MLPRRLPQRVTDSSPEGSPLCGTGANPSVAGALRQLRESATLSEFQELNPIQVFTLPNRVYFYALTVEVTIILLHACG